MRNFLREWQAEFKQTFTGTREPVPDWVPRLAAGDDPGHHPPGSAVWPCPGDMPTIVLERIQNGLAAARARGRAGGTKPSPAEGQAEQRKALHDASKASVNRLMRSSGVAQTPISSTGEQTR